MLENNLSFKFTHTPNIIFGAGKFKSLKDISLVRKSKNIILVLGGSSFRKSLQYEWMMEQFQKWGVTSYPVQVTGEPSPELIDLTTTQYRKYNIDLVIAIGGGSVLDAGKAISAMLTQEESVMAFIENAGEGKIHDGRKVPFIAIPTTAGTGSEATKNAVLSRIGENGFKNSLRHDNFVPDIALIDPELTVTCPLNVTASSGMDALCQLIESYISDASNPMTDALALSGIEHVKGSLEDVAANEPDNIDKRAKMSFAALISGITLANAGLGVVHGFASSIGGLFDIPHGVICGTLLPEAVKMTVHELLKHKEDKAQFIYKFARIGEILCGANAGDAEKSCFALIEYLEALKKRLKLPGLSQFGVSAHHAKTIASKTSNKNNPVRLNEEQLMQIVINCL